MTASQFVNGCEVEVWHLDRRSGGFLQLRNDTNDTHCICNLSVCNLNIRASRRPNH
jgi:hypothetical protein